MSGMPYAALGSRPRSRAVFIQSRGSRLFLGRSLERNEQEVTLEEVEALTSAGFEIVEINMREGAPLCAALARVPADETRSDLSAWLSHAVSTNLKARASSVVGLLEGLVGE